MLLSTCILVASNNSAYAFDPAAKALKLCSSALFSPDKFESELKELEFQVRGVNTEQQGMNLKAFAKGNEFLTVFEVSYSDLTSTNCSYSVSFPQTEQQMDTFVEKLIVDRIIGPFEHKKLRYGKAGDGRERLSYLFHRAGRNPILGGSVVTSYNFFSFDLTRSTYRDQ